MALRVTLAIALAGVLLGLIGLALHSRIFGMRLLFDPHDIRVYFESSRWIFGYGTLYQDVASEYPPLANLVFAIARTVASTINRDALPFEYVWVIAAGLVYLYALARVASETSQLAMLAWLAPAPIYFALFRYDIYPAAALLLAMLALRRDDHFEGAFWIGIAIALKGFALFLLPAFFVFVFYRSSLKAAIYGAGLALAPIIVSLFAVLVFAGWQGVAAPFALQSGRGFNGESLYDAINYVANFAFTAKDISPFPPLAQLACSLIAAAMRPRTFPELVNAFLFAVLGFITFSTFYSPQFVLWILPIASFSSSCAILISSVAFSWLTFLYFPISYDLAHHEPAFKVSVVAVTALRLLLMALVVFDWYRSDADESFSNMRQAK